jgi:hypothetical protein
MKNTMLMDCESSQKDWPQHPPENSLAVAARDDTAL